MCPFPVPLPHGLAILLSVVATTMSPAQQIVVVQPRQEKAPPLKAAEPPPGSVHRMVIWEGPNRRVRYVPTGSLSPRDFLAAYNLERAESELTYARDLQRLKQQYVNSERILEPHRRAVQLRLYGRQVSYSSYNSSYVNYVPNTSYGYPGGIYGYYGAFSPYLYSPYFGGSYGYGSRGGAYGGYGSSSYSETDSLQFGTGDEGVMKNAIVQVIATQSTPEYADTAMRGYEAAVTRAGASPTLSRDLGLPKSQLPPPKPEPSFQMGSKTTIWVGNEKYVGTVKDDRPDWVILHTGKAEVAVRKSEITRSEVESKP